MLIKLRYSKMLRGSNVGQRNSGKIEQRADYKKWLKYQWVRLKLKRARCYKLM
jgi:hypothetical protein